MSDIGTAAWFAEIEYYNLKRGRESERNKNLDGLITELNKLGFKKQQVLEVIVNAFYLSQEEAQKRYEYVLDLEPELLDIKKKYSFKNFERYPRYSDTPLSDEELISKVAHSAKIDEQLVAEWYEEFKIKKEKGELK